MFNNSIEKWAFILSGILAIAFISTSLFEEKIFEEKYFSFLLFIIWLIFLLTYYFSKIGYGAYIIIKPVNVYLSMLFKKIEREEKLLNLLVDYPVEEIEKTINKLKYEKGSILSGVGFLLGALEKVGIVPTLIAFYFSYSKSGDELLNSDTSQTILAILVGIYVSVFIAKHIFDWIEHKIYLLELARYNIEKRNSISK